MAPGYWIPEGGGPGEPKAEAGEKFKYPMIMQPLEAFRSQLAYLQSPNVAYVRDDMLVDASGKKLSL